MTFKILVEPGGLAFGAEPDETLLEALLRQGLSMPYGCKSGACGACRGQVRRGEIDPGPYQPFALSASDLEAGKALFCCARAQSDLTLEHPGIVPEATIQPRIIPARVEKLERRAQDVIVLLLRLPAGEAFPFHAGQFIDFLLPGGLRRSYSLANAPEEEGVLEFHIRRVPGGVFTGHVFENLKVRDILRLEGPYGSFHLHEESRKPAILLASGTGLAPVKAMVEHARAAGVLRPFHLYWGCRREEDFYLWELPEQWAQTIPDFHYTPVLSEPEPGWRGRAGFVHAAVMEDHPDLADWQVYACGAPAMVAAARQDFTARCRLPETEFFADAFTLQSVAP
ncbi:MAG: CDP-6-deoxy-delta-3,4-glucoseen reductase [Zoogloeaceae bacterium]|nr:CDP-6-deoxy-delta-3,4-glucoseen reductase [Zoogloeaceae bacterium]